MQILTFPLGQLQANCYILTQENECLIIDPGDSADFILEEVMRKNLKVVGLLATHGHFDHVMAAGELQLSLEILYQSPLPLHICKEDEFLIKRVKETAKHFLGHTPGIIPINSLEFIIEGQLTIGSFEFKVIHSPGHTPGSCSFHFSIDSAIFTGDTLFKGAVGDYSHKYSDRNKLQDSVKRIISLDEATTIYPGHGEDTLVRDESNKIYFNR